MNYRTCHGCRHRQYGCDLLERLKGWTADMNEGLRGHGLPVLTAVKINCAKRTEGLEPGAHVSVQLRNIHRYEHDSDGWQSIGGYIYDHLKTGKVRVWLVEPVVFAPQDSEPSDDDYRERSLVKVWTNRLTLTGREPSKLCGGCGRPLILGDVTSWWDCEVCGEEHPYAAADRAQSDFQDAGARAGGP